MTLTGASMIPDSAPWSVVIPATEDRFSLNCSLSSDSIKYRHATLVVFLIVLACPTPKVLNCITLDLKLELMSKFALTSGRCINDLG